MEGIDGLAGVVTAALGKDPASGDLYVFKIRRPVEAKGVVLLPKRWVVERTFAWLGRARRLSRDDERLTTSSECMIRVRGLQVLLERMAASGRHAPFRHRVAAKRGFPDRLSARGEPMPGLFVVDDHAPFRRVIDDVLVLDGASDYDEWASLTISIPL